MSEHFWEKRGRSACVVSVVANIFLVAFALGHLSNHEARPPMGAPGMMPPMGHERQQGDFRPGMAPPMFGPGDLFGAGEVREDEARMRAHFEKMDMMRNDFVAKLKAGAVSKEDVLKHFADMDQEVENVKKKAQDRAADKISAMSEADRQKLVERLSRPARKPEAPPPQ